MKLIKFLNKINDKKERKYELWLWFGDNNYSYNIYLETLYKNYPLDHDNYMILHSKIKHYEIEYNPTYTDRIIIKIRLENINCVTRANFL